jgi:gamma-glutamylaminecyclotransferase
MTTFTVFVYGTLKRGFDNHRILANSKFISTAHTLHSYPMISIYKAFPYLIDVEGEGFCVNGEVYETNYRTMLRIDELKGRPDHYTMREIEVVLEDKTVVKAIVYFLAEKIQYDKYPFLKEFEMDEDILRDYGSIMQDKTINWCAKNFYLKGYHGKLKLILA